MNYLLPKFTILIEENIQREKKKKLFLRENQIQKHG